MERHARPVRGPDGGGVILAGELQGLRIERLRQQCPLTNEKKMAGGVDGVRPRVDKELRLLPVEGSDEDRVELALRTGRVASRKEEEATSVRKKERPPVRGLLP